jgi:release factor glutamine methyltransferase
VAEARARLAGAGIPPAEADRDARLLASWQLGWDASRYWIGANEPEPVGFTAGYEALIARRASREPVAYITGMQEFWGLAFEVSPAVLIPRPETELIVEAALGLLPNRNVPVDIADACTGSGCLAIALASELSRARLVATDISDNALAVARRNAERHGVAGRIGLVRSDLLHGVAGPFHIIVANPPYVPERDRQTLQPEVRDHEPGEALFAGDAGLSVIPRLIEQASSRLRGGGVLIFEFGFGQLDAVSAMISSAAAFGEPDIRADLQGIPRIAVVQRSDV